MKNGLVWTSRLLISVIFVEVVAIFFLLFEIMNITITAKISALSQKSTLPRLWEFVKMWLPSNNSRLVVELKPNSTIKFEN